MQGISKKMWWTILVCAALLGIWPGIGVGQPNWIFFGALFGWMFFPFELHNLLSHPFLELPIFWFQLLAAFGYPLAMLGYSACATWTIRITHSTLKGRIVVALAAFVSTLASIPSAALTMSIIQHQNFFIAYVTYPVILVYHVFIFINLFLSAIFGWLIALGLTRRRRHEREANGALSQ